MPPIPGPASEAADPPRVALLGDANAQPLRRHCRPEAVQDKQDVNSKTDPISCAVAVVGTLVLGIALTGLYRAVEAPQSAAAPVAAPTVTVKNQQAAPAATVPVSQQATPATPRG